MKTAWDEVEKMIIEMNTTILSISQRAKDLEIENERLQRLVDAYKAKADLLIERVRPVDMHDETGTIGLTIGQNVIPLTFGKIK